MNEPEREINRFLVEIFNDVLHLEEASLANGPCKNLSVSELHVLEAVQNGGQEPSMSELAAKLRVTASTLTIAVKTLEQKGYLVRRRSQQDRRRVTVHLTEQADTALTHHAQFHQHLVEGVCRNLGAEQTRDLARALNSLHEFFTGL